MANCIEKVMAEGHDEETAIAICKSSLGFTKAAPSARMYFAYLPTDDVEEASRRIREMAAEADEEFAQGADSQYVPVHTNTRAHVPSSTQKKRRGQGRTRPSHPSSR